MFGLWHEVKKKDPNQVFLEPPAVSFWGRDWVDLLKRSGPWRALLKVHRRQNPSPFAAAEERAKGGLVAVLRPEELLLVPLWVGAELPAPRPLPLPPGRFPLAEVRVLPRVRLFPKEGTMRPPFLTPWVEGIYAALRYSSCERELREAVYPVVWDPGRGKVESLTRLEFLVAVDRAVAPSGVAELIGCLEEGIGRHREELLSLRAEQGPYILVPMRKGVLVVGGAGNAMPILFGDEGELELLILKSVPPEWGRVREFLLLLPQKTAEGALSAWARRVSRELGLSAGQVLNWARVAYAQVEAEGRPGAFVVADRFYGLVMSPVLYSNLKYGQE